MKNFSVLIISVSPKQHFYFALWALLQQSLYVWMKPALWIWRSICNWFSVCDSCDLHYTHTWKLYEPHIDTYYKWYICRYNMWFVNFLLALMDFSTHLCKERFGVLTDVLQWMKPPVRFLFLLGYKVIQMTQAAGDGCVIPYTAGEVVWKHFNQYKYCDTCSGFSI